MAIYTPRGLKIRLPLDYTFALLARLYPRVDAFRVLKTTEGIESIPSLLAFCTAMVCFGLHTTPFIVGLAVTIAVTFGTLLTSRGLFIIPGFVALGTLYSYLAGYFIYFTAIIVVGYITTGIGGVAAYFAARVIAFIIQQVFEFSDTKAAFAATGMPLTAAEKNFINAYRLHASRIGETIDVEVSDDELDESNWSEVFGDLAYKWPQVVQRFTPN